jgi:hypothetical protein
MICDICGKDLDKVTECAWTGCIKNWEISQDELKELLDYNPETGIFVWKKHLKQSNKYEGDLAGCLHGGGYIAIQIKGIRYYAHRLAWLYMYGKFPEKELDHINRVKSDNRISNLREVTRSQNMRNVGIRQDNTSGETHISFRMDRGKYRVSVTENGCFKSLGHFKTIEEAKNVLDVYKKWMDDWDEDRIDQIGQNGNDGLHYPELKGFRNEI